MSRHRGKPGEKSYTFSGSAKDRLAGKVTDRTEVRGFTFMTYTWRGSHYEVDLDHFTLCRSANPQATAAITPPPVVRTATGQVIPGRLECAFYDLGGEGVAYHDTEPVNTLSGVLNQEKTTSAPPPLLTIGISGRMKELIFHIRRTSPILAIPICLIRL